MPKSSRRNFMRSPTITIFLKASPICFNERFSCSIFSSTGIRKADWR